jgi:hypothetical protein
MLKIVGSSSHDLDIRCFSRAALGFSLFVVPGASR